jgi:hypothetical protein
MKPCLLEKGLGVRGLIDGHFNTPGPLLSLLLRLERPTQVMSFPSDHSLMTNLALDLGALQLPELSHIDLLIGIKLG